MKKKILTVAMACALGAACLLGAAGCNNGNEGENSAPSAVVTEEVWKEAFNKLSEETVFSAKYIYEYNQESKAGFNIDLPEEDINRTAVSYKERNEVNYSVTDNCFNLDQKYEEVNKGVSTGGVAKGYGEKIDDVWYFTGYSVNGWTDVSTQVVRDYLWFVKGINQMHFSTEVEQSSNNKIGLLKDLYSAFTYVDGAYSAKLYEYALEEYNENPLEYQIKIKIDNDGYLFYYFQMSEKNFNNEYGAYDNRKENVTILISDYGKATAETNAEARQAIDKYIDDNKAN